MHKEFYTIQSLLHYARETPGQQGKGSYVAGIVSDELAAKIASSTGLEVAGYPLTVDHSAIIHALRQHGQAVEVLRGQIPITEADLLALAAWLPTPTQVTDAGQMAGQFRCLRFEMATLAARAIAILEVRTGRNRPQLALKTFYKKRPVA